MNGEDYCKVFSISVYGDHTPLLDSVADSPQIREFSLRDSAGVDTKIKTMRLHDKIFKLQFFDFSKQKQFKFLRGKFNPHAIIIVYDATVMVSFNKAEMWLEENAIPGSGRARMLLVGNDHNLDDNDDNKVVNTDTGKVNFHNSYDKLRWYDSEYFL